jgi:hypothetical protein
MCRCAPPAGQHTYARPAAGAAAVATAARRWASTLTSWFWAPVSRTQMYLSLSMVTLVKVMAFCCTPRSWSCRGEARRGGGRAQQWAAAVAGGRRCSSRRACPAPSRRSNRLGWFAGRGGEPPRSCTTAGRGDRVAAVNDRVTAAGAASGTHVEDLTQAQRWCRHPVDRAGSCSRTLRARALIALPLLFSSPRVQARVELGGPIGGWGAESRQ